MEKKRERGPNYTHNEKLLLARLVTKYRHIIEDKRIGGIFIKKKKEAWQEITKSYNDHCTTGPRETEQLKTLYDNLKQKSRKSVVENNQSEHINAKGPMVPDIESQEDSTKAFITNIKEEKSEIYKTVESMWKQEPREVEEEIKCLIQLEVEPLVNPYDGAHGYLDQFQNHFLNPAPSTSSDAIEAVRNDDMSQNLSNEALTPPASEHRSSQKKHSTAQKKKKNGDSADELKRLYFKKKCLNAQLEQKKLKLEILYLKQEHDLRMRVLKNKLSISE